jgi:molybdate transport system regulatory protein
MPRGRIRVRSALTLETRAGALAGKRWMDLLDSIGATRSISAAARAIGLSYKAAWDAVDAMNNLADKPLVTRAVGGRGGGGARLTARGRQLVATFRAIEKENANFLDLLNERIGTLSEDLPILGRLAMLTSARNHFAGTISRISKGAVNDEVEVTLPGGQRLVAVITHDSLENLGLKVGREVIALVKASWVIVAVEGAAPLKLSTRNRLAGTVARLQRGAVNSEVVVALKGGNSVTAIITNASAKQLKLAVGKPASAVFKASSVILGVTP